jgi:hypothetical protein
MSILVDVSIPNLVIIILMAAVVTDAQFQCCIR